MKRDRQQGAPCQEQAQHSQNTSESEKAQNVRETKTPFLESPTSCAQEVSFPVGASLVSTAQLTQLTPSQGLHRPRAAHRGMETLPVLGDYIISLARCCCSLTLSMCLVKLLAVLFPVKTVVIIVS